MFMWHLALTRTLFSPPNTPVPEVQQVLLPKFVDEEVSLRGWLVQDQGHTTSKSQVTDTRILFTVWKCLLLGILPGSSYHSPITYQHLGT